MTLADGQVVESGRHADLIARGGLYARLFTIQASGYRDDEPASSPPATDRPSLEDAGTPR